MRLLPSAPTLPSVGALAVRAAAPEMIALPTCSAAGIWGVAAGAGAVAAASQLGLVAAFRRSNDRILSSAPGYVAHQVVALGFMLFPPCVGCAAWISPAVAAADAAARLLVPIGTTRFLAAMLFGALVVWDLPCSLLVPKLRKTDMIAHHVLMAAVALNGMTFIPMLYGVYYLGVVELSTVPLTLHEFFAHAASVAEGEGATSEGGEADERELISKPRRDARLARLRDCPQVAAALGFFFVRGLAFTRVTLLRFVPDCLTALTMPAAASLRLPLLFMLSSSVAFATLQLYWLSLLIKYTVSSGFGGERPATA